MCCHVTPCDAMLCQVCEQLRLEISKVHAERIEKVERKVSIKLVNKDPSKRVRIIAGGRERV